MDEASRLSAPPPNRRLLYRHAFIRNCHRWLAAGYAILDLRALSRTEEPAITGELVRAVLRKLEQKDVASTSPSWRLRQEPARTS